MAKGRTPQTPQGEGHILFICVFGDWQNSWHKVGTQIFLEDEVNRIITLLFSNYYVLCQTLGLSVSPWVTMRALAPDSCSPTWLTTCKFCKALVFHHDWPCLHMCLCDVCLSSPPLWLDSSQPKQRDEVAFECLSICTTHRATVELAFKMFTPHCWGSGKSSLLNLAWLGR